MSGDSRGDGEKLLERFSEEAYSAAMEACRDLRRIAAENPDLMVTILDTLPGLIDSWAYYTLAYIDTLSDEDKLRELGANLPSIITSLVTSVYGLRAGLPLAVLLLVPAGPLTRAVARCGHEGDDPVVEPSSPFEARLRATIVSAQASAYRVHLAVMASLEEESGEEDMWRPRDARILHM